MTMIVSCFALGFLYNDLFLFAAAVLCIIFGLLLVVEGIDLKTGETDNTYINMGNNTITEKEYNYIKFDKLITNAFGLIFILIGIGFAYFEKRGRNDGEDQWGQDGKWL